MRIKLYSVTIGILLCFSSVIGLHAQAPPMERIITTLAGNGISAYTGDGGPATSAGMRGPWGVAVDNRGNVYIADFMGNAIRKVDQYGNISTVAGTGLGGFSGDGGPANTAQISNPWGVAADNEGSIYIAAGNRVRKVDPSGIITTIAGTGAATFSGDGGLAINAGLSANGIMVDGNKNIYIGDYSNKRVRKIDASGIITTIAGTGAGGFSGDGGPAINAALDGPTGLAMDKEGNIYIADVSNYRIRKIDTNGIITTIAGNGAMTYDGEAIPANTASISRSYSMTVDGSGNIYLSAYDQNRILKIDKDGILTTVAGNGVRGFAGDGGTSTGAQLNYPTGITVDNKGNLYFAEQSNRRVRKISFSVPSNLAATPVNGKPYLTWTGVNGATAYNIYRGTNSGTLTLLSGMPVTGASYSDNNIVGGATYYYAVSAINGADESALSPEALVILTNPPVITSNGGGTAAGVNFAENNISAVTTATATDADNDAINYSISGADADKFHIDAISGVLTFINAPDFESPASSEASNVYVITLKASDIHGASATQVLTVTVTDINENPPLVYGVSNHEISRFDKTITFANATATLNGQPFSSGNIVSQEGTYVLIATSTWGYTTTVNFIIDKTAPTYTGVQHTEITNQNRTPVFSDGVIKLNGNLYISGTVISTEGEHTLIAVDEAGNETIVKFTTDKTPPAYSGVLNNELTNQSRTITFNEGTATLSGQAFNSGSTVANDGTYALSITDAAGNNTRVTFTIDKTAPVVSGVPASKEVILGDAVTFNEGTATLNGVPFISGTVFGMEGVYRLVVTDAAGNQTSLSFDVVNKINTSPTLAAIADAAVCFTTDLQTITLTGITAGTETDQNATVTASADNTSLFDIFQVNQSGENGAVLYKLKNGVSGQAVITVTVKDNGGTERGGIDTYSRSFVLKVNPLPVADISSGKGLSISKGETTVLSASGGSSYVWENGSTGQELSVRPEKTTTYSVSAVNANGCSSQHSITIEVKEDYLTISGTNIVTPNGDGVNDNLVIRNIDMYTNNILRIYDRAGRLIYTKKNYINDWNGSFNGLPLIEDTYYYILDVDNGKNRFKGYITIVRN